MKYDSEHHGSVFTRKGFEVVKVQTVQSKVQFITYLESSDMAFDLTPLKTIPGVLCMFQPVYKTDFGSLIDYRIFFERSLGVLHEGVVASFLVKLKDHLKSIQVCLGEVDLWLLDAHSNMEFLEKNSV